MGWRSFHCRICRLACVSHVWKGKILEICSRSLYPNRVGLVLVLSLRSLPHCVSMVGHFFPTVFHSIHLLGFHHRHRRPPRALGGGRPRPFVKSTLPCGQWRSTGGTTLERCEVVRRKPKTRKTWIRGGDMAVRTCATRTCDARRRGGTLVRVERTKRLQARVAARAKEDGKMEIVHVEECADGAKIIRFGTAEEARSASVQETKKEGGEHLPPIAEMEPRELEQVQEETVGSGGMLHEVEAVETPTVSTESDNQANAYEETKNETVPSQDSKDMSSLKVAELRTLAKQKGITVSVADNTCVRR
mmetsp:Transcript_2965/g.18636  ORF Transcript_2965/g.18636 Transcript_2965/m.18636 type:complete len:304 (+) Transcript_2965:1588-2499(+)